MVENEHDTPDASQGAGDPRTPEHGAPVEGALDSQEPDRELFAHQSEPDEPEVATREAAPESAPEPAIVTPARKSRGYWQKLTLFVAVLGLLATAIGLGAMKFKGKDERLRAISDAIEAAAKDPGGVASTLETKLADLWAPAPPAAEDDRKPKPRRSAANEAAPTPSPAAEQKPPPVSETPRPAPTPSWASPQEPKPAPVAEPTPATPPAVRSEDGAQIGALVKRIEQLETTVREAARDAQLVAKSPEAGEKTAAPTSDQGSYLNALEGRIDELAD